jgi:hypothetical protein
MQARTLEKPVVLLASDDLLPTLEVENAQAALDRLQTIKPFAAIVNPKELIASLADFAKRYPQAELIWIAEGLMFESLSLEDMYAPLKAFSRIRARVMRDEQGRLRDVITLHHLRQTPEGLEVDAARSFTPSVAPLTLTAKDIQGLVVGQVKATFEAGQKEITAIFDLPVEIRNTIRRVEVEGARTAASVAMLDTRMSRQRVGVIQAASADALNSLLAPGYYLNKALSPFADVSVKSGAVGDAVNFFVNARMRVLVLADVGALDPETTKQLNTFMNEGGILIRFSGPRLALASSEMASDPLTPVRLRKGGRSFGGALSWDQPKTLAPFPANSPFAALKVPADVKILRQLMAEPALDLVGKTWAALSDGTPFITAQVRGQGRLVLFHVSADPGWSNLPLSGLFVQMLRQILTLSPPSITKESETGSGISTSETIFPPLQILEGDGSMMSGVQAFKPLRLPDIGRARAEHPAGLYGAVEASVAVNVLENQDRLVPVPVENIVQRVDSLDTTQRVELRSLFLILLTFLVLVDTVIVCRYAFTRLRGVGKSVAASCALWFLAGLSVMMFSIGEPAFAQDVAKKQESLIIAASKVHLAYVMTGDAPTDRTSRAGMLGVAQVLRERTSVEPGDPIGLDPAKDEMAFYPLIYWPIVPGRPLPSDTAIRRLDAYMKNGGTVIFDTRDANTVTWADAPTPATQYLRAMLVTLDIPELEPLPRDHVLTRAFYLLDDLVGRYATGRTWTEILPVEALEGKRRPVRSGDGISPIIITSNDLAAAWAVDEAGQSLHAIVGGTERQREMALRGGINLMMYALTGNYKADQVHVAPLLERLGQ